MRSLRFPSFCLVLLLSVVLTGCSGSSGTGGTSTGGGSTPTPAIFSIAGASPSVLLGATVQFTATGSTAASWLVNGTTGGSAATGTISASGLYTAPATLPANATITVSATNTAQTSATATVSIQSDLKVSIGGPPAGPILTQTAVPLTITVASAGAPSTAVNWTVNGVANGNTASGTITAGANGGVTYTAPATQPTAAVQIVATSVADSSKSATLALTVQGLILSSATAAPGDTITAQGHFNTATPLNFFFSDNGSYSKTLATTANSATSATFVVPPYTTTAGAFGQGTLSISAQQLVNSTLTNLGTVSGFAVSALVPAPSAAGDVTLAVLSSAYTAMDMTNHEWSFLATASSGVVDASPIANAATDAKKHLLSLIQQVSAVRDGGSFLIGTIQASPLTVNAASLAAIDGLLQAYVVAPGATAAYSQLAPAEQARYVTHAGKLDAADALSLFLAHPHAVSPSTVGLFLGSLALAAGGTVAIVPVAVVCAVASAAIMFAEHTVNPGMQAILSNGSDPTASFQGGSNAYAIVPGASPAGTALLTDVAALETDELVYQQQMNTTTKTSIGSKIIADLANISKQTAVLAKSLGSATLSAVPLVTYENGGVLLNVVVNDAVPSSTYTVSTTYGDQMTTTTIDGEASVNVNIPAPAAGTPCTNVSISLLVGIAPVTKISGCYGSPTPSSVYIGQAANFGASYGGGQYCNYSLAVSDINMRIEVDGSGNVVPGLGMTYYNIESTVGTCAAQPYPANTANFAVASGTVKGNAITVHFARSDGSATYADLTGTISGNTLTGTMVVNRGDLVGTAVYWTGTTSVTLTK